MLFEYDWEVSPESVLGIWSLVGWYQEVKVRTTPSHLTGVRTAAVLSASTAMNYISLIHYRNRKYADALNLRCSHFAGLNVLGYRMLAVDRTSELGPFTPHDVTDLPLHLHPVSLIIETSATFSAAEPH